MSNIPLALSYIPLVVLYGYHIMVQLLHLISKILNISVRFYLGHGEIVEKIFLARELNVNLQDDRGNTALIYAAAQGRYCQNNYLKYIHIYIQISLKTF